MTADSTPTLVSAPNADAIAAILARSLPLDHPYVVVNSDPLARFVALTPAQLALLDDECRTIESVEYERLTRRARRHPNGIRRHKARAARSAAKSTAWCHWSRRAYELRRENAKAVLSAEPTLACPDCGEPMPDDGRYRNGHDYLCPACYQTFVAEMTDWLASCEAAEVPA